MKKSVQLEQFRREVTTRNAAIAEACAADCPPTQYANNSPRRVDRNRQQRLRLSPIGTLPLRLAATA
jgi:hypothetical protein